MVARLIILCPSPGVRAMDRGPVISYVHDNIYFIVFNRPEKLNALNLDSWRLLREHASKACSGGYKALVLTGRGRAFSAGDDILEMHALSTPEESTRFFNSLRSALLELVNCGKPLIAGVNGIAVGGGAEILFLMDYVIAVKGAWISYPEAGIGLLPPILLSVGVNVVGGRVARRLALTGDRLSVEDAQRLGIIDEVVEADMLDKAIYNAVERLSTIPGELVKLFRIETLGGIERAHSLIDRLSLLVLTGYAKKRMEDFIKKRKG